MCDQNNLCTTSGTIRKSGEYKIIRAVSADLLSTLDFYEIVIRVTLNPIALTQTTPQSLVASSSTDYVTINVIEEINALTIPIFYYDSADNSKQLLYCIISTAEVVSCNIPHDIQNTVGGYYTVYYYNKLSNSKERTGVEFEVNIPTINFIAMYFRDQTTGPCAIKPDYSGTVYFETDEIITNQIEQISLQRIEDGTINTLSTCGFGSNKKGSCYRSDKSFEGSYKIKNVIGSKRYDISQIEDTIIISIAVPFQKNVQLYSYSMIPSVEIQLQNANQEILVYPTANPSALTQTIPCQKKENNPSILICTQIQQLQPTLGYSGICQGNRIYSTLNILIVQNVQATNRIIYIKSLQFDVNQYCVVNNQQKWFSVLTEPFNGNIRMVKINQETSRGTGYSSSTCTHISLGSSDLLNCTNTPARNMNKGIFVLTYMMGETGLYFDFSKIVSNRIALYTDLVLGEQSITLPVVNSKNPTFNIMLYQANTKQRPFYAGSQCQTVIPCAKKGIILTCSPNYSVMNRYQEVEVYYIDDCNVKIFTGIKYKYVRTEDIIRLSGLSIFEDSQYTIRNTKSFMLRTFDKPLGTITSIKIKNINTGNVLTLLDCAISLEFLYTIECPLSNFPEGRYSYVDSSAESYYDSMTMTSNFIKISFIINGLQIVEHYIINSSYPSFKVFFESGTLIEIFLENDETATIPCIPINEYYQCTPTLSSLSLGQTYSIYYHDNLDALLATGVTIELASDSTVINNIYSLSLPNDDICTTSVFNAVIVRTDAQITKESTAQIQIKKREDGSTFQTEICTVNVDSTNSSIDILTCGIPSGTDVSKGWFYISNIIGVSSVYEILYLTQLKRF